MAKTVKTPRKSSKKELREQVESILIKNLEEIRTRLGEKKFSKNVKKASKILTSGVSGSARKAPAKTVKAAAKPTEAVGDKSEARTETKTIAKTPAKKKAEA